MNFWVELTVVIFLLLGGVFLLIGSIGLARLPDIYTRLHGPTKATTLGIAGTLIASSIVHSYYQGSFSVNEWLITLFLIITAPVAANMIAKTALHQQIKAIHKTTGQHLIATAKDRLPPATETDSDKA